MKLNLNQIKDITTGAARIEEIDGKVCFSRFTDEQRFLYKNRDENCYLRSLSSSGIKMSFSTDSENLSLIIDVSPGSSRKYFSVDVFSNDTCIGHIDNFKEEDMPKKYIETKLPLDENSKTFSLGSGIKDITIYLPWSMNTVLKEISVDDGSIVTPKKRSNTLLAFGDSITQGYDALRSSDTYVAKLSRALDADEINKGIGGETFFPELALTKENITPDFITVAYGTNDWSLLDKPTFQKNCIEFFKNLRNTYESAKIFAITPLWRTDVENITNLGAFSELEETIKMACENLNISVISGMDLVPHDENFFADLFVHPNKAGFEHFYKNLYQKIVNNNF